ncbi:MAG: SAM-dependent methyltransferase [Alphaproteobacteria bacterium]|nr:SAM-dependent methyltransferase [Alphaproteobacteria bacterium]
MESDRRDWLEWHKPYDDPNSSLSRRLAIVRRELASALDAHGPKPLRLVSMCAGQGRDVVPVLAAHHMRSQTTATLVELDKRNTNIAKSDAKARGLTNVRVVEGDAALTDSYAGSVPADIVLACGIFGNIVDDDIRRTIETLPTLCARGATVIWTRGREQHRDLSQDIRKWFGSTGFREVAFHAPEDARFRVGVSRLAIPPKPFARGIRMFRFVR